MSRKTWMDRTIAAAREAEVTMPWSRTPAPKPAESASDARIAED